MLSLHDLKTAFRAWRADQASYLAAALSYHAVFSLAPLLIVALGIAGALYGQADNQAAFLTMIGDFFGPQTAGLVTSLLEQQQFAAQSGWAVLIGIGITLFGAINGVQRLREGVNLIWDAPKRARTTWEKISHYLLLLFLLGATGVLLLASLAASAILTQSNAFLSAQLGIDLLWLLPIGNAVVSLGVITVLFAGIFKYLPDARVPWRAVWPAAFLTAVLFNVGKFVIGFYLGRTSIASLYGAAGSLAVFLVWVFYEAQIFLYGVEVVKQETKKRLHERQAD